MKDLGLRIKNLRKSTGLTQQGLANKLNISDSSTISQWERGVNSPYGRDLVKLSKVFNVSTDYILGIRQEKKNQEYNMYTYLPTAISAGLPIDVEAITQSETISLPDNVMGKWAGNKEILISSIYGDSMDKIMPDGSLIAIKPINLTELKNGDIVVFSTNGEYSVKYFYKRPDKIVFKPHSHNKDFDDQSYGLEDNIAIHGKVVLYIVELD